VDSCSRLPSLALGLGVRIPSGPTDHVSVGMSRRLHALYSSLCCLFLVELVLYEDVYNVLPALVCAEVTKEQCRIPRWAREDFCHGSTID
jgi:hypothetical protein